MNTKNVSLIDTVVTHWRDFALVWVFPIFFLLGGSVSEVLGYPNTFFWLAALPVFFLSFYRAIRPWLKEEVSYWSLVFWVMLVPFLIWVVAVFTRMFIIRMFSGNA